MSKGLKVTKSEQWPKFHKFWSKVKKVTKSEQWPKCHKLWTKVKFCVNSVKIMDKVRNVKRSEQNVQT